jgi:uncharacterized protein (DUF58 family)
MESASLEHEESDSDSARVRLGRGAYLLLCLGLLPALLGGLEDAFLGVLAIDVGVLLLFLYDASRLQQAQLQLARQVPRRLQLGKSDVLELTLRNASSLSLEVWLRDELPPATFPAAPEVRRLSLSPQADATLRSTVTPIARGRASLGHVAVRLETRLGLAAVYRELGRREEVRVWPGLSLDLHTQRAQRDEAGEVAQRLRKSASGSELESLREYVSADSLRSIDWKATARRHRPITRVHQPERSQILWLVLDASRTMATPIGSALRSPSPRDATAVPKSRLDTAVETSLSLADAALHAGDQVGLLIYADTRLALVPPGRGRRHYLRLAESLSDVTAEPVHLAVRSLLSDFEGLARKRALVVLFTDLENEAHTAALCEHAQLLTRRHLPVCVSLHDVETEQLASLRPQEDAQVFRQAAAIDLLLERETLTRKLQKRGVRVVESDARGLAQKVLDQYLRVKLSAQL